MTLNELAITRNPSFNNLLKIPSKPVVLLTEKFSIVLITSLGFISGFLSKLQSFSPRFLISFFFFRFSEYYTWNIHNSNPWGPMRWLRSKPVLLILLYLRYWSHHGEVFSSLICIHGAFLNKLIPSVRFAWCFPKNCSGQADHKNYSSAVFGIKTMVSCIG